MGERAFDERHAKMQRRPVEAELLLKRENREVMFHRDRSRSAIEKQRFPVDRTDHGAAREVMIARRPRRRKERGAEKKCDGHPFRAAKQRHQENEWKVQRDWMTEDRQSHHDSGRDCAPA